MNPHLYWTNFLSPTVTPHLRYIESAFVLHQFLITKLIPSLGIPPSVLSNLQYWGWNQQSCGEALTCNRYINFKPRSTNYMYIHVVQNNNIKKHFCPVYMFVFIYMYVYNLPFLRNYLLSTAWAMEKHKRKVLTFKRKIVCASHTLNIHWTYREYYVT